MRNAVILMLAICAGVLSAQPIGGGGGGAGGTANDITIMPAGGPLDYGTVGQTYWRYPGLETSNVHQSNPDNYLTWEVVQGVLPPGLKLIPDGDVNAGTVLGTGNCAFAGVPTLAGSYAFTVKVRDNFSGTVDVQRYSIVILDANDFVITIGSLPDAETGVSFSQSIQCTVAGAGAYNWSWQAVPGSQLPPGLSLDTGATSIATTLSGTPTTAGDYEFIVTVSQGAQSASQRYCLRVGDMPLSIASPNPLPSGLESTHYGFRFTGSRGVPPYRWLSDNLPAGFELDAGTGYLHNPAPQAGIYNFDVTLWDANPAQGSSLAHTTVNFTLTIAANTGGGSLAITTPGSLPEGVAGSIYMQTLAASGGSQPYTWSATGLPTGFSLSSSGVLSAPASSVVVGGYSFDVTVTDSTSATDTRTFTLQVRDPIPRASSGSSDSGGCVGSTQSRLSWLLLFLVPLLLRRRARA